MMTRADKLTAVFLLLSALAAYIIFSCAVFSDRAEYAVITVNGAEYARYRPSEITGVKTVTVDEGFGRNVVELSSGGARVTDASCPDKLDVKSGMITKPNQMLICVPNRLTVKLTGGKKNIDRVTY